VEADFREKTSKEFFKEASLFYDSPSTPNAFYHRAVKVKGTVFSSIRVMSKIFSKLSWTRMCLFSSKSILVKLTNGGI
jgi:hypothetical protein